jgi:hypothetical protein
MFGAETKPVYVRGLQRTPGCPDTDPMDVAIATPIQIGEVTPPSCRVLRFAAGFVSAVMNIAAPLYQDDAADTKTRYR